MPQIINKENWFDNNPKKAIIFIIIFGFLVIDFSLAAALKIAGGFEPSYVTSSVREAYYRRADPVYHHGLKNNISNYIAEWDKQDYRVDYKNLDLGGQINYTTTYSLNLTSNQNFIFYSDQLSSLVTKSLNSLTATSTGILSQSIDQPHSLQPKLSIPSLSSIIHA